MGVYGLSSYISKHSSEYLTDHKLQNCVVIIDGNAAASLVYSNLTRSNHAFGGDYDRYAHSTQEFIKLLIKCNVRPIFIFDGGYEIRKLRTIIERIKLNIIICGQYKNKYRESKSFPLLFRDIFRMILHDLGIVVIQCDFEADHEIVTLAKLLHCPVISSDSDFYVSNILYIPFTSIEFKLVRSKRKNAKCKYFIPCKIFSVDEFLNQLGGLENRSLLPLLSCALGNDYIPRNTFKNFLNLNGLKFDDRLWKIVKWLRTVTSVDQAIDEMIATLQRNQRNTRNWIEQLIHEHSRNSSDLLLYIPSEFVVNTILAGNLSNMYVTYPLNSISGNCNAEKCTVTSISNDSVINECDSYNSIYSSAVDNNSYDMSSTSFSYKETNDHFFEEDGVIVLSVEEFEIIRDSESEIEDTMDETEEEFNNTNSSYVESNSCNITSYSDVNTTVGCDTANSSCITTVSHTSDHATLGDSMMNYSCEKINNLEIPPWFIKKFRSGLISPTVINILSFQKMFIMSQSEDYFSGPSHEICLRILQFVIGIVFGNNVEAKRVQCYARIKNMELGVFHIEPVFDVPSIGRLPSLALISSLSVESRKRILLGCLDIPFTTKLDLFPEEWRLYIITLMYWKKNCQQCTINGSHIRALFLCLIYLSVIDRKIGFIRSNSDLKKFHKLMKTELNTPEIENGETRAKTNVEPSSYFGATMNADYMNFISKKDCFKAADALLIYHQMNPNLLKNRKQFNVKLVHRFAQLQHCIQNIMLLNSVLDFPFLQYHPWSVFSGTFLYNIYMELHTRQLADGYITRNLLAKANTIISFYRYLMMAWEKCTSLKEKLPKVRKKKVRRKKGASTNHNQSKNDEFNEEYYDSDNIFSKLPME